MSFRVLEPLYVKTNKQGMLLRKYYKPRHGVMQLPPQNLIIK